MSVRIIVGDALAELRKLADESVQTCVTSPPYWGLRAYSTEHQVFGGDPACAHAWDNVVPAVRRSGGTASSTLGEASGGHGMSDAGRLRSIERQMHDGQASFFCALCGAWRGELGLEPDYRLYIEHLVEIFREVRRVLRRDGTLWLNLGDSYTSGDRATFRSGASENKGQRVQDDMPRPRTPIGLKPKDLMMIPARVAIALQDDGWYLRQDIIWSKPNPMPESVTDRCTKAHEYLFLLSKSERYYYDAESIKEDSITDDPRRPYTSAGAWQLDGRPKEQRHGGKPRTAGNKSHKYVEAYDASDTEEHRTKAGLLKIADVPWYSRNKRSVWTVATAPYPGAHFATMPPDLATPCILAGAPPRGVVLDPFLGSGTTIMVADRLGRDGIGIELNPDYAKMAERRCREPGFAFDLATAPTEPRILDDG